MDGREVREAAGSHRADTVPHAAMDDIARAEGGANRTSLCSSGPPIYRGRSGIFGHRIEPPDSDGFTGRAQAGYDWQAGSAVFGIEGDYNAFDLRGSFTNVGTPPGNVTLSSPRIRD